MTRSCATWIPSDYEGVFFHDMNIHVDHRNLQDSNVLARIVHVQYPLLDLPHVRVGDNIDSLYHHLEHHSRGEIKDSSLSPSLFRELQRSNIPFMRVEETQWPPQHACDCCGRCPIKRYVASMSNISEDGICASFVGTSDCTHLSIDWRHNITCMHMHTVVRGHEARLPPSYDAPLPQSQFTDDIPLFIRYLGTP